MVLKAKDTMVAMDTPFDLVLVSKISAGIIQLRGPAVDEKQKLYNQQPTTMKPQLAPLLEFEGLSGSGGNLARRTVATMKQRALPMLPRIRGHRRPNLSMNSKQRN
jgi:hypothetical protein